MSNPAMGATATILVVDDTAANLRLLADILSQAGHRVRPTRDGQLALLAAQTDPPDLILLDIMMPGLDGYEVCQQLKADPKTRDIPVIFISALDDVHDKVRSFTLGAVDYVTKPIQAEEVLARVNTHVALHRLQRDLREQIAELDAFGHTVAHDLKNPLAYISSSAEFIIDYGDAIPEALGVHLGKMYDASRRAINIIDELLLLASVRKQEVTLQPLDMQMIVLQARDRLLYVVERFEAHIVLPESWPVALGYAPWVEEVWANYLSNGLKYGGRPPHLELGATKQPDGFIRFWVRDNGPGISPDKQAVLFTEFKRLGQLKIEGSGLGLSIVQRIINKLGGRTGVNSELGRGSEFYFELPPAG